MSGEYYRQSSRAPTRSYTPPLIATERDFHQKIIDEVLETRQFIDKVLDRLYYLEWLVKDYAPPPSTYPPPLYVHHFQNVSCFFLNLFIL